jgi:hypothetical protein
MLSWERGSKTFVPGAHSTSFHRRPAQPTTGWTRGHTLASGFEGYVAKDQLSPYRGGVTRSWLKAKVPGLTDPEDKFKRMRLES